MATENEVNVAVDLDVCQGYVNCAVEADSYFAIGDNGKVRLLRTAVDPGDLPAVEMAVSSCPVAALSLTRRTSE